MTINVFPLSKELTTTNLVVDSNVDMTGYDFKADNVEGNEVHADTARLDHVVEHTGAHGVKVDSAVASTVGATGFASKLVQTTATGGADQDQPLDFTRDRQAHKITLAATEWILMASLLIKKDTGLPTGTLTCRVRRVDNDAIIQEAVNTFSLAACTAAFVEKTFVLNPPTALYAGAVYVSFEVVSGSGSWNANYCVVANGAGTTLPEYYKEGAGAWTAVANTQMDGKIVVVSGP